MQVLTVKASVKVPTVPNFLISDGDMQFPLSAFDDDALRQIAAAWTVDLLNNAERQRIQLRNELAFDKYASAPSDGLPTDTRESKGGRE